MNWEGYEVEGQMDISEFLDDKGENMNESAEKLYTNYSTMLSDLEQYRAIGTVAEFKALKEKNVSKKVIVKKSEKIELDVCDEKGNVHLCPNCNDYIICADMKHCLNCGQALEH